jgi:hypothetical protein
LLVRKDTEKRKKNPKWARRRKSKRKRERIDSKISIITLNEIEDEGNVRAHHEKRNWDSGNDWEDKKKKEWKEKNHEAIINQRFQG